MSGSANAYLHGMRADGVWIPVRIDESGVLGGSGAGSGFRNYTAWSYAAAAGGITNTSDVALKAAPGVGRSNYLTNLQICNKHATTGTEVEVKNGSTVIWRGYAPPNGVQIDVEFPNALYASNNTALNVACVTTGTATLINAQGYTDQSFDALQALVTSEEEIFADDGTLLLDDSGNTLTLN